MMNGSAWSLSVYALPHQPRVPIPYPDRPATEEEVAIRQAKIAERNRAARKARRTMRKQAKPAVRTAAQRRYVAYLRTAHWKALRAQVLMRDHYRCRFCGATSGLEVHHLTYERLGHEALTDLVTACHSCHHRIHRPNTYRRSKPRS